MTITPQIYDTSTLLEVMRYLPDEPTYWMDMLTGGDVNFDSEFIEFEKLTEAKIMAPFVAPMVRGVPIFSQGSSAQRFRPAYTKLKDPLTPNRLIKRKPGEMFSNAPMSIAERRDAYIADINRVHRNAIRRLWEFLANRAIVDGQVTISGENYPSTLVQFGRASAHTITLAGTARWGQSASQIVENLNTWIEMIRNATFGGVVTRVTVAPDVWNVMRKDDELRQLMDSQVRGTVVNLNIGIRQGLPAEKVGNLSPGIELWVYNGSYINTNGVSTAMLASGQVVLTANDMQGHMTWGAIMDDDSDYQPLSIFPKMFKENDPSGVFVMNQSSPLAVVVNPNNTLLANVL